MVNFHTNQNILLYTTTVYCTMRSITENVEDVSLNGPVMMWFEMYATLLTF